MNHTKSEELAIEPGILATREDQEVDGGELQPTISWGGSAPTLPLVDDQDANNDCDSAIGGMSVMTSTLSLRSSIYEHVEENDEQEQERLDIQHALFGVTLKGKLHLAPIGEKPRNVLDIATGTGIWAVEFAQQYPSAQVVGTDLSAIQFLYVPPNCRFEIDDAEDQWIFDEKFDYIHGRALLTCFKDPASVLRQAFISLAPGGYLELQDGTFPFKYVGESPTESNLYKWNELVVAGAAKSG